MPRADSSLGLHARSLARIAERYEVLHSLGRGGMAVVYRVRDASDGREYALKQLVLTGTERDRAMRTQLEQEFSVLSQLSHPSVIEVRDYGDHPEGPFYTMELLDGGDLVERAPFDYRQACTFILELCSSLSVLHSRGLVHRDISPRNVRWTRSGRAKLIDFGAMAVMGQSLPGVGTPGFVAPEVMRRQTLDARTDLFSLGATLYFALTGKRPFAARSLADANEAWQHEPPPPSAHVPNLPEALDGLVVSLLQLDVTRRPASAFEVMQRLGAILGLRETEPEEIARVYFDTPGLVGRETEQRCFRQQLRATLGAQGGCLIFEGEAGSGRSRVLQSCAIAAQVAGALVVHVAGRTADGKPFGIARSIARAIVRQLPESSLASARASGVMQQLFDVSNDLGVCSIRDSEQWATDRYGTSRDLTAWLRDLTQGHSVIIVLDDVERVDEASVAWLAVLSHAACDRRLLIVATLDPAAATGGVPALELLRSHARRQPVLPLSAANIQQLFGSVFNGAPHTALVSSRIHRIAGGNLRECLALARELLERRLISYDSGGFSLPVDLAAADLPTTIELALMQRVAELPPLARELSEAQALALEEPWTLRDYELLVSEADRPRLSAALKGLVHRGLLVDEHGHFTLPRRVRDCLSERLSAAERIEHHARLAQWCVVSGRPVLSEVHHRLEAAETSRALLALASVLNSGQTATAIHNGSGIHRKRLVNILERAHGFVRIERPAREFYELLQRLLELSTTTDETLYYRYAPTWLAQLELDSGLCDYRELSAEQPKDQRLHRALEQAHARYERTPAQDRVYTPLEAIKALAHFCVYSLAIVARTADARLCASVPMLLEPFSGLALPLDAFRDMAMAAYDMYFGAQLERARRRFTAVHEYLCNLGDSTQFAYLSTMRDGVALAAAAAEADLGYDSVEHSLEAMRGDPLNRLGALSLRRLVCIFDRDEKGAAQYREQADLIAVQTDGVGLVPVRVALELSAYLQARNLAGVKYLLDRLHQLVAKFPGWRALEAYATGAFESLRGDLPAARRELEKAMALTEPGAAEAQQLNIWFSATAAHVTVLTELGLAHHAREEALRARARAEQLGVPTPPALERALAIAEAEVGECVTAAARLDALIAQHGHLRGSFRALDLEARSRVAIAAGDASAAARFVELAITTCGAGASGMRARLVAAARERGLVIDLGVTRGAAPPADDAARQRGTELASIPQLEARARRVLALLMEATGANRGRLYYAGSSGVRCVAQSDAAPHPVLDAFVAAHLDQRRESAAMTTLFTGMSDAPEPRVTSWADADDVAHHLVVLQLAAENACVGLAALSGIADLEVRTEHVALTEAIAATLHQLGDVE
jgi:hypothetical protein